MSELRVVVDVLLFAAIGVGLIVAMGALQVLPSEPWNGVVGLVLGVLALLGAFALELRRL